jgi:hypothetical protein
MKSLGCLGCKEIGCGGPVTLEETMRKNEKEEKKMEQQSRELPKKKTGRPKKQTITPEDAQAVGEAFEAMAIQEGEAVTPEEQILLETGLHLPPGINAETDAAIRFELDEMAKLTMRRPRPTIAPQLVATYGDKLRAVRERGHGWRKIAKVFRRNGLHIGENSLRANIEA